MDRPLLTARLLRKLLLSERTQCYHLEFSVDGMEHFPFEAGQFVSTVVTDSRGKQQTRAYSIASAPRRNEFDLCVNRVEDGFFSNLLCSLEPGQTVPFHGPHGLFLLRRPLTDSVLIATGTGIAPMRGFVEQLFPAGGPSRADGREVTLVYGTRHKTELYYATFFQRVAAEHPGFRYITTLSRPHEGWEGPRGYVQDEVERIIRAHHTFRPSDIEHGDGASPPVAPAAEAPLHFDVHAYICGLNEMVAAIRERLKSLGWHRKQIVFERYD